MDSVDSPCKVDDRCSFQISFPFSSSVFSFRYPLFFTLFLFLLSLPVFICSSFEQKKFQAPEWSKSAVIYEVNLRQYSETKPLSTLTNNILQLKALGITTLWLMPIHPIGLINRKTVAGSTKEQLGSPYSISNYRAINPEYLESEKELHALIDTAHRNKMTIVLDWVAGHTAWDHSWAENHPEYYKHKSDGEFTPPEGTDWTDVIALNYDNRNGLREAMIAEMDYWVTNFHIDGFRCDEASKVPLRFWEQARRTLEKSHHGPLFFLAETWKPEYQSVFDAIYGWELRHRAIETLHGAYTYSLRDVLAQQNDEWSYPLGSAFLQFSSNHDENSWKGNEFAQNIFRTDSGVKLYSVLMATAPGVPLLYNGQEIGMKKKLAFFEKDAIAWKNGTSSLREANFRHFYQTLFALKEKAFPALHSNAGFEMIHTHSDHEILAYRRFQKLENVNFEPEVIVLMNWSPNKKEFFFKYDENHGRMILGRYLDYFERTVRDYADWGMTLEGASYKVLIKLPPESLYSSSLVPKGLREFYEGLDQSRPLAHHRRGPTSRTQQSLRKPLQLR